jgi:hypothetical protein
MPPVLHTVLCLDQHRKGGGILRMHLVDVGPDPIGAVKVSFRILSRFRVLKQGPIRWVATVKQDITRHAKIFPASLEHTSTANYSIVRE